MFDLGRQALIQSDPTTAWSGAPARRIGLDRSLTDLDWPPPLAAVRLGGLTISRWNASRAKHRLRQRRTDVFATVRALFYCRWWYNNALPVNANHDRQERLAPNSLISLSYYGFLMVPGVENGQSGRVASRCKSVHMA